MILASILLAAAALAFGLIFHGAYRLSRTRQFRAVMEGEVFLNRLHKMCLEARDVEPFAGTLADEILKHRVELFNESLKPKGK